MPGAEPVFVYRLSSDNLLYNNIMCYYCMCVCMCARCTRGGRENDGGSGRGVGGERLGGT